MPPSLQSLYSQLKPSKSGNRRYQEHWESMFNRLSKLTRKLGHATPNSENCSDKDLIHWCANQRTSLKRRRMTQERFEKLHSIGFVFLPASSLNATETSCSEDPSDDAAENPEGAAGSAGSTESTDDEDEDEDEEEEVRETMDIKERYNLIWQSWYDKLLKFYLEHGYSSLNRWNCHGDRRLASWCANQRSTYRQRGYPAERLALLEAIGFEMGFKGSESSPTEAAQQLRDVGALEGWLVQYAALKEYMTQHENRELTAEDDPALFAWCLSQRAASLKGVLGKPLRQKLAKLGFAFDSSDPHSVADSGSDSSPGRVGPHVRAAPPQKTVAYSPEVIAQRENRWMGRFEQLQKFAQKHGHSSPTTKTCTFNGLVSWCSHQRSAFWAGTLGAERKGLLDSIGFEFAPLRNVQKASEARSNSAPPGQAPAELTDMDPREAVWMSNYGDLKEFFNENGHSTPSSATCPKRNLVSWCANQRTAYRRQRLNEKRTELLKDINFDFHRMSQTREKNIQIGRASCRERV